MSDFENIMRMLKGERGRAAGLVMMLADLISKVETDIHRPIVTIWDFQRPYFLYVSDTYLEATGLTKGEALSRSFMEAIDPTYRDAGLAEWGKNSEIGITRLTNFRSDHMDKDGNVIPMWWDGVNDSNIGFGGGLAYLYDRYAVL